MANSWQTRSRGIHFPNMGVARVMRGHPRLHHWPRSPIRCPNLRSPLMSVAQRYGTVHKSVPQCCLFFWWIIWTYQKNAFILGGTILHSKSFFAFLILNCPRVCFKNNPDKSVEKRQRVEMYFLMAHHNIFVTTAVILLIALGLRLRFKSSMDGYR